MVEFTVICKFSCVNIFKSKNYMPFQCLQGSFFRTRTIFLNGLGSYTKECDSFPNALHVINTQLIISRLCIIPCWASLTNGHNTVEGNSKVLRTVHSGKLSHPPEWREMPTSSWLSTLGFSVSGPAPYNWPRSGLPVSYSLLQCTAAVSVKCQAKPGLWPTR